MIFFRVLVLPVLVLSNSYIHSGAGSSASVESTSVSISFPDLWIESQPDMEVSESVPVVSDSVFKSQQESSAPEVTLQQSTIVIETDISQDNKKSNVSVFFDQQQQEAPARFESQANIHHAMVLNQTDQLLAPNAIALLKNKNLNEVQVDYFERFHQADWQVYLNNTLGLENSPQVFQLHSLYQFPHFREVIQSLPGYDQAMIDLYNRLDYSGGRTCDRNLYDSIAYLPAGISVYECLHNSSAVQARIAEQAIEFADQLSKRTIEDQIEQIELLKKDRSATRTRLHQKEMQERFAKRESGSSLCNKDVATHITFNDAVDQLKVDVLDQQIAQLKCNSADWESKLSQDLSEKPASEFPTIRMDILGRINNVDKHILARNNDLNNAVAKMDHTNHREQQREIQRIQQQRTLLNGKWHCLHKQLELVQAHEYLAQNQNGLHSQERLNALQGKTVQSTITLNPQAQKIIQEMGVNPKLFSYTARTTLQMQSQQEAIALINKLAEQKGYSADTQICDATVQIIQSAVRASIQGDIAKSWAWVDVGNCLLDAAECIWNCSEAYMESAAQRLEVLSVAAADALCHPVQAAQQIMNSAVNLLKVLADKDFQQRMGKSVIKGMYISGVVDGDFPTNVADLEKVAGMLNEMTEGITPITLAHTAGEWTVDLLAFDGALKLAGAVKGIAVAEVVAPAHKAEGVIPKLAQAEVAVVAATVAIEAKEAEIVEKFGKEALEAAHRERAAMNAVRQIEKAAAKKFAAEQIALLNNGRKASLEWLHPSVGNIERLEQAIEFFKDIPGAVGADGPITKLLECGSKESRIGLLNTARGAAYELEAALKLEALGEKVIEFGRKFGTREFDIITKNIWAECKNIDWTLGNASKMQTTFGEQLKMAKSANCDFVLYSKQPIPTNWKNWFTEKGIKFFEL